MEENSWRLSFGDCLNATFLFPTFSGLSHTSSYFQRLIVHFPHLQCVFFLYHHFQPCQWVGGRRCKQSPPQSHTGRDRTAPATHEDASVVERVVGPELLRPALCVNCNFSVPSEDDTREVQCKPHAQEAEAGWPAWATQRPCLKTNPILLRSTHHGKRLRKAALRGIA